MEAAVDKIAMVSVKSEFSDAADFTIEEVITRIRKAAIIDDDEVDPDKPGKTSLTVENFREAWRLELAESSAQELDQPNKTSGDFGEMSTDEVVKLVRNPEGPLNWALFRVSDSLN